MQRKSLPRSTVCSTSNFCIYCGTHLQEWEKVIDHFKPFAHYESNSLSNLFVSCRECNSIKSDKVFDSIESARSYILPIKEEKGVPVKIPISVQKREEKIQKEQAYYTGVCKCCGAETSKKLYCSNMCKYIKDLSNTETIQEIMKFTGPRRSQWAGWRTRLADMGFQ